MANELAFGFKSGLTLLGFVYQVDGTERDFGVGDNGITMTEVAGAALYDGLYLGDCATIAASDYVVIANNADGRIVGFGQHQPEVSTTATDADIAAMAAEVTLILEDTATTLPASIAEIVTSNNSVTNVYDDSTPPPVTVIYD